MTTTLRERYQELGPKQFARWFLIKRIGKGIVNRFDDFMATQSKVGNPPVFDGSEFPWVAELEADWKEVRRELDALLEYRELLPQGEVLGSQSGSASKQRPEENEDHVYRTHAPLPNPLPLYIC